jgi:6-phosphofructokinase 1
VRIGVLTGGGDCPGLNAVLRAVVRRGVVTHADEFVGFLDSWEGVLERRTMSLTIDAMRGHLPRGGTVLGSRRGSPLDLPDGPDQVRQALDDLDIEGIIVVGGNGSLTVASILWEEHGLPMLGVPKTIDNDIVGTDQTFGFSTAVQVATEAIDRLHTTAESHDRVMVVEVMGRHAGWIATYAGIAGGATAILIPEQAFDLDEVCALLRQRHERGRYASIVVVAEGAEPREGTLSAPERTYDQYGHVRLGGISELIAPAIEARTGFETRVVKLGHVQRGGSPTAYDRVLATRYGTAAADLAHEMAWGQMVVLRGSDITRAPMSMCAGRTRPVDLDLYTDVASVFFG